MTAKANAFKITCQKLVVMLVPVMGLGLTVVTSSRGSSSALQSSQVHLAELSTVKILGRSEKFEV